MHDRPPHHISKDLQQTNSEKAGLFVDIFTYFKSGKFEQVAICHAVSDLNQAIPVKPYNIEIEISSDNGGETISKSFQLDPSRDAKNMLRMLDD
jgi:hypothetical protein